MEEKQQMFKEGVETLIDSCLGATWPRWRSTRWTWAGAPTWWPWTPRWCSGPSRTWPAPSGGPASWPGCRASGAACCGSPPSWPRAGRSAWSGPRGSSCCTPWASAPPSPRCASSTPCGGEQESHRRWLLWFVFLSTQTHTHRHVYAHTHTPYSLFHLLFSIVFILRESFLTCFERQQIQRNW